MASVFLGRGGKEGLVWSAASGLLLFSGLLAVSIKGIRFFLRQPVFIFLIGFLFLQGISALASPCPPAAFPSVNKAWVSLAFGMAAYAFWSSSYYGFFHLSILAAGILQAFLILSYRVFHTPFYLVLPGNPQYGGLWMCAAAMLGLGYACSSQSQETNGAPPAAQNKIFFRRDSLFQRAAFLLISLILILAVLLYPSRSAVLGLSAGLGVFLYRRFGRRALMVFLLLSALLAFFLPRDHWKGFLKSRDPLAWKRLGIWEAALKGIRQKPLLGWGPGRFEALYSRFASPQDGLPVRFGFSTAFAHNDFLQTASEAGLPALLLLGAGAIYCLARPSARDSLSIGHQAALGATAVFCFFNFPLVLPVNGLLVAGLAAGGNPEDRDTPSFPEPVWAGRLLMAVLAALIAANGAAGASFLAHRLGYDRLARNLNFWSTDPFVEEAGQKLHPSDGLSPDAETAERLLLTAVSRCPDNAQAWHDLAHLYSAHQNPPAWTEARESLQRALDLRPLNAPWFVEQSKLLEEGSDPQGALNAARKALELEPRYGAAALQIGRLLYQAGEPVKAEEWLRNFLSFKEKEPPLNPEHSSPYVREILRNVEEEMRREMARNHPPE